MNNNSFIDLVEKNNGFELVIGYRNDIDHYIGGLKNKYWYQIKKGNKNKYYIGTYNNGTWEDKYYEAKGNNIESVQNIEPRTTINKIEERAFYYQDKINNKKPIEIAKEEDTYLHYVYGLGDKAWEVSKKYGVTTFYSNINNEEENYHLRNIFIGSDVEKPKEK